MTLPSSGALPFSSIQTEFGGTNPISMSEYYAGGGLVSAGATGLNGAIPSSGQNSMSKYYAASGVPPPPSYGIWVWGSNASGQLGIGTVASKSSPVQVGSLTTWKQISRGSSSSTAAIKTDGTLWAWGSNAAGLLGLGDTTNRSSPTQVGSLTNWASVFVGGQAVHAIKTDGTLWAWGAGSTGQLGQGSDLGNKSSPIQIGALTDWLSVSSGLAVVLAIKTDGTLWSWGQNTNGQLGLGNTTPKSSPTQVGSLTNWSQVSCDCFSQNASCAAIKTDGTLWTWGFNTQGSLGLGNITHRSSPTQVGSLTNWATISATYGHNMAAIKTDGTLWTWGQNSYGDLGSGTTVWRSSPVQVGSLNTWTTVFAGFTMMALKNDNTVWMWGYNTEGQLTGADKLHKSSPVQVGSLATWSIINSNGANAFAMLA